MRRPEEVPCRCSSAYCFSTLKHSLFLANVSTLLFHSRIGSAFYVILGSKILRPVFAVLAVFVHPRALCPS
ncbi:hypothetical protein C8R41DRAFT_821289 [Lentinula lateritia]|uniref:Uncharacterized protein n=1 Tax=Lentinula lateritia TaxID=40482 RepID=A0ABQ8VNI4_9AGAR|nr:hypothetical protein C8R41DRAFT_821289 [Lentinula lateritia]